jgi:hypothetical protein
MSIKPIVILEHIRVRNWILELHSNRNRPNASPSMRNQASNIKLNIKRICEKKKKEKSLFELEIANVWHISF